MENQGPQIFIIHPDRDFRDNLVHELRENEFEAFAISQSELDELSNRRDSIYFLHAAENGDWDWQGISEGLRHDSHGQTLVAMGSSTQPEGFDGSIGYSEKGFSEAVTGYLDHLGARGHRHYIRFGSQYASIATFDFHRGEKRFAGIIHDISAAGVSCTFRPEPESLGRKSVKDMHLNLPGYRATVSGHFVSHRVVAGQTIRVFNFDGDVSDEVREHIHDFIYSSLETKLSLH